MCLISKIDYQKPVKLLGPIKSAQSKMKLHYDENAQDRNFEPGDKVLALLPIPGKPLQARYYGPYTVDKKLSDVNYTVNTPVMSYQHA